MRDMQILVLPAPVHENKGIARQGRSLQKLSLPIMVAAA